jgi:plastocyanin
MHKTTAIALLWIWICAAAAQGAELRVSVKDHKGKPVADAVILAVPLDPKNALRGKPAADAVDQVDKQFVPYVKPVFVGATVRFPNSDNIRHQVYSFSPAKKFELPLYGGLDATPVVFDKPGVVVLGCNIHDWMVGYIYVSETPFFAKTGTAGSAIIADLPAGEYTVRIWHPNLVHPEDTTTRHVSLGTDEPISAEWQLDLKPNFRVPRASGSGSAAYP